MLCLRILLRYCKCTHNKFHHSSDEIYRSVKALVTTAKQMKRVFGVKPAVSTAINSITTAVAPTVVEVMETFKGDYNVLITHQKVLAHFKKRSEQLPVRKAQLAQLQWIHDNGNTVAERKLAALEITKEQEWVSKTEQKKDELQYIRLSQPLIEEYQRLAVGRKGRVFGEKKIVDENSDARELVIIKYLALARRYIDLHVSLDTSGDPICPVCDSLLVEGVGNCKNCPAFIAKFETDGSYKEPDSSKSTIRNNYAKNGHIYEAFIKFQGKQANNLPSGLVEDIDNTREAFNIPKDNLTIDMLYQIMRDKQYSSYYDDIYLIYHLITGKKLPDLEDIMPDLEKDANEFASIYPEIKPKARLNCLNAHFIRDSFLLRRGRIYPEWQCTFLRTEAVSMEHSSTMERAYERLDWGVYRPL